MEGIFTEYKIFLESDTKEGLVSPLHQPQYDLNPTNIIDTTTVPLPNPEDVMLDNPDYPPTEGKNEIKPAPVELEDRIEESKNEEDHIEKPTEAKVIEEKHETEQKLENPPIKEEQLPVLANEPKNAEIVPQEIPQNIEENKEFPEQPLPENNLEVDQLEKIEPPTKEEKKSVISKQDKEGGNENLGYLVQICVGKQHIMHLTEEGHIYSYGSGIYGVCGQGGAACCFQHQILRSLSDRKVIQIACGEYHSLALTNSQDIYAWGRGFEGQLGIAAKGKVEIAAKPTFIPFFDKKKVKCIAAGSYYSLAVTSEGELYGWGEARLGQLGCGKQSLIFTPQKITVREDPEDIMRKSHSTISIREKDVSTPKSANPDGPCKDFRVAKVAAGFGHTAAITEDGSLFMWGFNMFGQLGIGQKRNIKWKPVRVEKDIANGWLPKAKDVACGYNFTFMIDVNGKLYSWGKGYIGHNGLTEEDKPRRIETKTENREFTGIVCNDQAVVLFAPMRVYSVSPKCGPSCGGTVLSIIGTALKNTKNIKVRFAYGEKGEIVKEVEGTYIEQRYADQRLAQDQAALQSIFCTTPKFEDEESGNGVPEKKEPEIKQQQKFPQKCKVSITLDGVHYVECDQDFLIYPQTVKINNAHPKCGPVLGGTELVLMVDIDPMISNYLFNLCVGFQARPNGPPAGYSKKGTLEDKKESNDMDTSKSVVRKQSRMGTITPGGAARLAREGTTNSGGLQGVNGGYPINPLDPTDQQLDLDNWRCSTATYDAGKIMCQVPRLLKYDAENLQYNVDIALNGQQFSGYPIIFRYYDVSITDVTPKFGPTEGGTVLTVKGNGFYDSSGKKFKFETEFGEREMAAAWDRKERCFTCKSPPISWFFSGKNPAPEALEKLKNSQIKLRITLNGQNWIWVGYFEYYDAIITRMSYDTGFGEGMTEEEKKKKWLEEEPLPPKPADPEELKNLEAENAKKAEEENEEFNTTYKRTGAIFYIHGQKFRKSNVFFKLLTY